MAEHLWTEKYRPKTIDDCILPSNVKPIFDNLVLGGAEKMPNLLLCGKSGTGKTTVARVLADQLNMQYLFINASEDRNIDTLRVRIRNFASTQSLIDGSPIKMIILDEGDNLNPTSTQPALRGFIEEFSQTCRFVITCNYPEKLLDAIRSRMTEINFTVIDKLEKPKLMNQFLKRMESILGQEKVQYSTKTLIHIIAKYYPDLRRPINEIQKYSSSGALSDDVLQTSDINLKQLQTMMANKEFSSIRKWIAQGIYDPASIFRLLYDNVEVFFDPKSVPIAILIIAEYQYKLAFSADPEICLSAMFVNLMSECALVT